MKPCSTRYITTRSNRWSYSDWEQAGKASTSFNGFTLYLIKCYSEDEVFLKVGKTFTSLEKRFCNGEDMPYSYEVLGMWQHNAYAISNIESIIKARFKQHKYTPLLEFAGMHECLSFNEAIVIEDFIRSKLDKEDEETAVESK